MSDALRYIYFDMLLWLDGDVVQDEDSLVVPDGFLEGSLFDHVPAQVDDSKDGSIAFKLAVIGHFFKFKFKGFLFLEISLFFSFHCQISLTSG